MKEATLPEQGYSEFNKIAVEIGCPLINLICPLKIGFPFSYLLLPYIWWITDHHIKAYELTLIIKDFRKLKSPFERLIKKNAHFLIRFLFFQSLNLLLLFDDVFF